VYSYGRSIDADKTKNGSRKENRILVVNDLFRFIFNPRDVEERGKIEEGWKDVEDMEGCEWMWKDAHGCGRVEGCRGGRGMWKKNVGARIWKDKEGCGTM
jgi:hypothetical protein